MHRTPVTTTDDTQSDGYSVITAQAGKASPLPVLACASCSVSALALTSSSPRVNFGPYFLPGQVGKRTHCPQRVSVHEHTVLSASVAARGSRLGTLSGPTCSCVVFTDTKDAAPEVLQEAEQSIIRYEKCNEILKERLETKSDMVKKGAVCGYSALGKDSCQVSPWVLCHLCTLVVASKGLPPQGVGPVSSASPSIHP